MDTLTMQGQDSRKLMSTNFDMGKVVMDMAPTPSDAGKQTTNQPLIGENGRNIASFC
jgi:hypothetical protein